MEDLWLTLEDAGNRAEWRRTRVADPSPEGFTAWIEEREIREGKKREKGRERGTY